MQKGKENKKEEKNIGSGGKDKPIPSLVIEPSKSAKKTTSARNEHRGSIKLAAAVISARPKVNKIFQSHRFLKKTFPKPTWCQFSNKFITGLNKTGYECRDCGMVVSRRFISDAKKTICGTPQDGLLDLTSGEMEINHEKVFKIYLPHGAKKSFVVKDPREQLRTVLEKVCRERAINMDDYVPEDTNGEECNLDITLGEIPGDSITFTLKDQHSDNATTPRNKDTKKKHRKSITQPPFLFKPTTLSPTPQYNHPSSSSSLSTNPPSSPKKRIMDMYEIGIELGSGAFSVVRQAQHKETNDLFAVKILDKYEEDDEQTQKFKQEIAIISSLHHENIVQFYELDEDQENFYVIMELVGGGELFDYIIDSKRIPEVESACIVAQVLKAIEYMHSIGTAHRDLKPENLLFKSSDHKIIKIADFGESKSFKEGALTTYCGTPDYMAPEIIRGDMPYGPETDVWAIGVITYVMLAGFPPFDGDNDVEVFASILAIRFNFPSPEWDPISSDAKEFIRLILLDNPKERLTAAQALQHRWIVNNVPPELRINQQPPPQQPQSTPSSKGDQQKKTTVESKIKGGSNEKESTPVRTPNNNGGVVKQVVIVPAGSPILLDSGPGKNKKIEEEVDILKINNPRKYLLDEMEEVLNRLGEQIYLLGEINSMMEVLEAAPGKKPMSELEKSIYVIYHKRLSDIKVNLSQLKKKKKNKN